MARHEPSQIRNALLRRLPNDEWDQIEDGFELVEMPTEAVLHEARVPLKHAHFPLSGCVSLLIELSDGFSTEVALIGNEGMIGAALVLDGTQSVAVAKVQIAGKALRIEAEALTTNLRDLTTFRHRLLHHTAAQVQRSMQLIACNAHHSLEARLARCLLGLHDRAARQLITVTHENLALLLCAHRPSISTVVKRLQQQGLIRQQVGSLLVSDRAGLEQASCECYSVVHALESAITLG